MTLPEIAVLAVYTIISNNSPTVLEVSGPGEWAMLEQACRRFVKRGIPGRCCDHVTVVVRSVDGKRELRDVGINDVRYGKLPPVGFKCKRKYAGLGVKGVRADGKRYRCQMTAHGVKLYLGMYDTIEEAGRVRDRYVIDHGLTVPLNFPQEELVTA